MEMVAEKVRGETCAMWERR